MSATWSVSDKESAREFLLSCEEWGEVFAIERASRSNMSAAISYRVYFDGDNRGMYLTKYIAIALDSTIRDAEVRITGYGLDRSHWGLYRALVWAGVPRDKANDIADRKLVRRHV